jgi:hypothetical protein
MARTLKQFLKDKDGNYSLREIVILLSFLALLACWVGEQFLGKPAPEYIFYSFVGIVMAGCFGYSIETSLIRLHKTGKTNPTTIPQGTANDADNFSQSQNQ